MKSPMKNCANIVSRVRSASIARTSRAVALLSYGHDQSLKSSMNSQDDKNRNS